ncbi:MAG: exodeoxyribonuclease VII small subunit [Spirochaetia bacterium]|nr:exodeoxyribonuclease VII small subunit [Spirochaetia bacterium]
MKSFEERLEKLEQLAEQIKDPKLPLEKAVSVFEEGIKLSRSLKKELESIQGKVEILLNDPDDEDAETPKTADFDTENQ